MGWHLSVLDATGPAATVETVHAAGYRPAGEPITVDEVISEIDQLVPDGSGVAVVEGDGADGVQLVGRFVDDDALAIALSAGGGEAVSLLWHSVSTTYVVAVFRDGRLRRRLVRVEGEVVADEGPPLPAEAMPGVRWDLDEEAALFALAGALLGEEVGSETWIGRLAVVHGPASASPSPRRRRALGRFGRR